MGKSLTFAIGDIHGCFEELRTLLDFCGMCAGSVEHEFGLVGDYVDRGSASDEVIAYLIKEPATGPRRFRCLLGKP